MNSDYRNSGYRQFFVHDSNIELAKHNEVKLSEADSHHARNVLKLKPSTTIRLVFPNQNSFAIAEISSVSNKQTIAIIKHLEYIPLKSRAVDTLLVALCKSKKNEFIIEKATELGVQNLVLIKTAHSEYRFRSQSDRAKKIIRWCSIAESAANQSNRLTIPSLSVYDSLPEAWNTISSHTPTLRFVCSLEPEARLASHFFPIKEPTGIAIGPEGDFSKEEYTLLTGANFRPLSLGNTILRSETAVVSGIATIQAISNV